MVDWDAANAMLLGRDNIEVAISDLRWPRRFVSWVNILGEERCTGFSQTLDERSSSKHRT
jgi:hypothetical protein